MYSTNFRSLFVTFRLVIVMSVLLRFTDSDYPFGIFKLFFYMGHIIVFFYLSTNNFYKWNSNQVYVRQLGVLLNQIYETKWYMLMTYIWDTIKMVLMW
jgi:hypothetical protein